jgi:oligopeptide/dipeptide ABC transporter ATP-binding protein
MTAQRASAGDSALNASQPGETGTPLLSVRGLRISERTEAGRRALVRDVTFDVGVGEIVCIVGESGSGKSLSVKATMGLLGRNARLVTDGSVIFDGRNILEMRPEQQRRLRGREIAMVFQEPLASLDPVMPVGRQVAESVRRAEGLRGQQARSRVTELFGHVGLPDVERVTRAYPHQLSGGMCQRVMIAMALASRPRLLIADEPTSALDVTVQAQLLDLLNRLRDQETMSILLVTHDLGVAAAIADTVVVMYAGRTAEVGQTAQILERPQHPYTAGLLGSVPRLGQFRGGTKRRLAAIEGTVPEPGRLPAGCAFAPRCQKVVERCLSEDPPLEWHGTSAVTCWEAQHDG